MTPTIHAGAVALGAHGLLIRGAPGTGKTALGLALVARWQAAGRFAALVADDRVALSAAHGALIARPAERLAGLVEVRGFGIVSVPHLPAVRLTRVIDLGAAPERMPDPADAVLCGVAVARITLAAGQSEAGASALWSLLGPFGS